MDGISIGNHPTVTWLLQEVFNSRPPQPRYVAFWDVGLVIQHIKSLGVNKDLSLKQLTMKTVMLLALTRPSQSAGLSKLNLKMRSFLSQMVWYSDQLIWQNNIGLQNLWQTSFFEVLMKTLPYIL